MSTPTLGSIVSSFISSVLSPIGVAHLIVNSLKFRLILSACAMIFLVLPLIGYTLSNAFEQKLIQSIKRELSAFSYSILAVAEVENNQLVMPEQLLENQFNVAQSGLYAIISQQGVSRQKSSPFSTTSNAPFDKPLINRVLWQSYSLLGLNVPEGLPSPNIGQTDFSRFHLADFQAGEESIVENINNAKSRNHFIYSYTVSFASTFNNEPYDFIFTIHILKSLSDFEYLLAQFQYQLWLWLLVLMLLLMIVQVFWLVWTLKPLHNLKLELQQVEQGNLNRLENNYPVELNQVTQQLNLLLATEQGQRKRYRNALADLAHSLKTPLAVIQSQSELTQSSQEQLGVINNIIEHQLKRAQTAGESSWHLGVNVGDVLTKLLGSLAKIYHDKGLTFLVKPERNSDEQKNVKAIFKGDEADLLELLGNLLDNACKAAISCVLVEVIFTNEQLLITVADDGSGVSEDMQKNILQRGTRADTYQQGHGIGLAIVGDLVASYQGQLSICQSKQLGGAEFSLTFTYN